MHKKQVSRIRLFVQIGFFLLIAVIAVSHSLEESGIHIPLLSSASLHSVCPFGGVVSTYQFFTAGTFVKKVHESSFILMWIVFALALLVGPAFCGWVCPMGSIQEWFGKLGRKLFGRRYNRFIPYKYDRILRFLRYGMLVWVLVMTIGSGQLFFQDIDPYFALFNFWTSEVAISGIVVLLVVLGLSLLVERPFCKYACPYGALLGIFNLFRIFAIRRNPATCINCKACDKSCPMNIPLSGSTGRVRHHQCISCLKCTSEQACPVDNTMELAAGKMKEATDGKTE